MLNVEMKREAFSLHDHHSFWVELTISIEGYVAIKSMYAKEDLIIQKFDKVYCIVLLKKHYCIKRMGKMLSDSSKIKKLDTKPGK